MSTAPTNASFLSSAPVWLYRNEVAAAVVSAGQHGPAPLPQRAGDVALEVLRAPEQRVAVVQVTDAQGTRVLLDPSIEDTTARRHVVAAALSPDGTRVAVLVAGTDEHAHLRLLDVKEGSVLTSSPEATRLRALAWDDGASHVWWVRSTDPAAGAQLMCSGPNDHHVRAFLPGPIAVAGLVPRPGGGVVATTRARSGPTYATRLASSQPSPPPPTTRLSEHPARLHRDRDRLLALVTSTPRPTVHEVTDRPDGLTLAHVVARGTSGRNVATLLDTGRGDPLLVEATRGTHIVSRLTPTGPVPLWDDRSRVHVRAITAAGPSPALHVSTPTAHGTLQIPDTAEPVSPVLRDDPATHLRATVCSADGTPVDVLISAPTELLDPSGRPRHPAPTLLTAYGGFGHASTAAYDAGARAWVMLGGVHATALVRGGGEHGTRWHEAGRGPDGKNRAVDDLTAAAELLATNWATGGAVALAGASHGALLAAAASLRAPRHVAAVTLLCPLLDLEHIDKDLLARLWTDELGDPTDHGTATLLRDLSPVQSAVTPGPPAPPTLILVAEDDARVPAHHGQRYAQALESGPRRPTRGPVLLRTLAGQGHGPRSSDRVNSLSTDLLTFARRWTTEGTASA